MIRKNKNEKLIDIDVLQTKAINMLKDVKEVLDKYELIYWLEAGPLLGYMRNKKLIPWDDEIDLGTFESNFPKIQDFCKEINRKGYISEYADDRIKIWKKDWKIGYFFVDLHLHRFVDGHYVCAYIEEKKSTFNMFFRNLERLERLFSCFDYKNKVEYYSFKDIAQVLLSNNIKPKDWKNIEFIKGPYNRQESFILKGSKFYIVNDPIKKFISSNFLNSMIVGLFKVLPKTLIEKIHIALKNLYKLRIYDRGVLKFPNYYFEDLSTINFYGIRIKIPKKSKDYLRDVYGDSWRTPNSAWQRKDMGVISR